MESKIDHMYWNKQNAKLEFKLLDDEICILEETINFQLKLYKPVIGQILWYLPNY